MIYFGKLLLGVSNWYSGLSNRSRLLLASVFFLFLFGLSSYKLLSAWSRLAEPLPKADPQQIIQPMQEIFRQAKGQYQQDEEARKTFIRLDSLAKIYDNKNNKKP